MKSGVCACEDGYEVEENECRLQYTLTAYELAVLRITFNNSLSSTLTSPKLTLTANCTDFSAILKTEITLAAYTLNLEFITTQESQCRGSRQQDRPNQKDSQRSAALSSPAVLRGQLHLSAD
jgi:hypothetical protein